MIAIEDGLKQASLKNGQKPRINLFTELFGIRSDDVISANGTYESEGISLQPTRNSFSIELDNTSGDYPAGAEGQWFPQNSGSIGTEVNIGTGYTNDGSSQTIFLQNGKIRSLTGNSKNKTADMYCVDNSLDLSIEVSDNTLYKNKKPGELIEILAGKAGYSTANLQGEKKLYIETNIDINTDEIGYNINFANYYKANLFSEIVKLVEVSSGKIFTDRYGDLHYMTRSLINQLNNSIIDIGNFVINDNPSDGEYPLFEENIGLNYNNIFNSINTNIYTYINQGNSYSIQTGYFKVKAGDTEVFETVFDGFVDGVTTKTVLGTENDDYSGVDYSGSCVFNYNDFPGGSEVTITNNHTNDLYIKIEYISDFFFLSVGGEQINTKDTTSIGIHGELIKKINNNYIQNNEILNNVNYQYLFLYKNPIRSCEIETTGILDLELYDSIQVVNNTEVKNKNIKGLVKKVQWFFDKTGGYFNRIYLDLIRDFLLFYFLENFVNTNNTDTTASLNIEIADGVLKLKEKIEFQDIDTFANEDKILVKYQLDVNNGEISLQEEIQ